MYLAVRIKNKKGEYGVQSLGKNSNEILFIGCSAQSTFHCTVKPEARKIRLHGERELRYTIEPLLFAAYRILYSENTVRDYKMDTSYRAPHPSRHHYQLRVLRHRCVKHLIIS